MYRSSIFGIEYEFRLVHLFTVILGLHMDESIGLFEGLQRSGVPIPNTVWVRFSPKTPACQALYPPFLAMHNVNVGFVFRSTLNDAV